ncbi:hypothetical protein GCM10017608_34830 [Agromyces luteolus]|uniref:DUF4255 domain-containing protein n=1 Tax=Agromyces luteolus TaxID=88373 RepID=A0A7C9LH11_9MICO|nr:DUF4255 domain-containing protein [Agromyces luteolus]MUN07395.1 DUF4255 domain-containing protein [Agromyces luteolus]GLK29545.1 hypothetical protein GCM10017608_34830 [Agromyces luteolus]
MIGEIDDAIRALVRRSDGIAADIEVALDAPTKEWAARRNAPTVDLFLYDIREDVRRREHGFTEQRDEHGAVTSRVPAPRFFKLSYLVTAWTQRPDDEHRLLDALLRCFLQYDAVPDSFVVDTLAETGLPCSINVALPPPEDRAFADVWSSLGGELKPSLDVVITAPMTRGISYPVGPPVDRVETRISADSLGVPDEVRSRPRVRVGGKRSRS